MINRVRWPWWRAVVLTAIFIAGGVGQASAQRTPGAMAGSLAVDDASPTIDRSSCVLMLKRNLRYAGPGFGPPTAGGSGLADLTALTTAMTTTGLIDPAAKAALGLGPRLWPKVVRIEVASAGAQAVKLSVVVNPAPNSLKQTEPAAALMRELISRAKAVVNQSAEGRREEIKLRLDEIEKRRVELKTSLESLRQRLREAEARGSRRAFNEPLAEQRRHVESELAVKRARLQAIKEVLPKADEMGTALQGLVAARDALVAGLEKAVGEGRGDALELLRARAELAESRVRLAEWGNVPSSSPSQTARDERIHLEIDVAALEARLKAMPRAEPPKPASEDAQDVRSEMFRFENESRNLETQYQQVRRDYEHLASPPTLVLLDGSPQ